MSETVGREELEFLGQLMTANVKWSQSISNAVEANLERDIVEWKAAYVALWDEVGRIAERIDSASLERLLDKTAHKRSWAGRKSYFEDGYKP